MTVKGPQQTGIRCSEYSEAASAKGFVEDGDYTEKVLVLTCISCQTECQYLIVCPRVNRDDVATFMLTVEYITRQI